MKDCGELIELEHCPFCGKEAYVSQTGCTIDGDSAHFHFSIKCRKCGATAPNAYGTISVNLNGKGELNTWHSDLQKAANNWNTRFDGEIKGLVQMGKIACETCPDKNDCTGCSFAEKYGAYTE